MSLWGGRQIGDHVKARRDIAAGFVDSVTGHATIKKGRRGIIRGVRPGWLWDRYTVEFSDGYLTKTIRDVRQPDLRRLVVGHGDQQWKWRRDVHVGVRLGLFAFFTLPALVAASLYFLHGGTIDGFLTGLMTAALSLLGHAVAFVGPTVALLVILSALWLRSRRQ